LLKGDIRDEMEFEDVGDFAHFPRYDTGDEYFLRLVKLSPEQINLIYQFSAWNVYSNPDQFSLLQK
jgi:hypothetical protein